MQQDIRKMLAETGLTQTEFAKIAGVHPVAFSKFMNREGCSIAERLVPFVYGDKRPNRNASSAHDQPQQLSNSPLECQR